MYNNTFFHMKLEDTKAGLKCISNFMIKHLTVYSVQKAMARKKLMRK